jgi:hypothetical protein
MDIHIGDMEREGRTINSDGYTDPEGMGEKEIEYPDNIPEAAAFIDGRDEMIAD